MVRIADDAEVDADSEARSQSPQMAASAPTPYRRTLLYLAQRLGEVPNTRLHKVVYLIDLEYHGRYGRTLTGAPWVRHNYGPMTKALLPALDDMADHELVQRVKTTRSDRTLKLITPGPALRYQPDLGPEEREVADFILALTRGLTDRQVLDLAYSTTPMRAVLRREATLGKKLIGEPIDFDAAPVLPGAEETDAPGYAAFKRVETQALSSTRRRLLASFAG
ncbi:MAG: Panacea domain-containing protein [Candidatus Limnocylindrales bacterium]